MTSIGTVHRGPAPRDGPRYTSTATASYRRADLVAALRAVGIAPGDAVFFHVCADTLGTMVDAADGDDAGADALLAALREAVGDAGTLLVPSYTFAFCRQEVFDVRATPSVAGMWSTSGALLEGVRRHAAAVRSRDPIHAIAGIGPLAHALLDDVPATCFGPDCVHDRLRRAGGKVCTIGVGLHEAAFRHHVEEMVGAPFRYKKLFTGRIRDAEGERPIGWVYSVRILAEAGAPDGRHLEALLFAEGCARAAGVGLGEVQAVDCASFYETTAQLLRESPWATASGPAGDPVALEAARVGGAVPHVALPARASMRAMLEGLGPMRRDIVSDGYDAALAALGTQVPLRVHEFATGTECWSWIVPEKWTCHEAYLETLDGRRLFSYADHPLHVVSYSLPFDGVVSRDVLLAHLHVHPQLPDAIPFVFKYYERDWGLCCARTLRDTLRDEAYRVVIRSAFSYGTLKVGEVVVRGRSDDAVVLCAHLCHPAQVNDDLTGVVVGIDVMRALLAGPRPRLTYRLLILPETIGSIAYLARHPELAARMRAGLFLEMLGRDEPHALQHTFAGDTAADRCLTMALREADPDAWTAPFRTLPGNDERQFNAPGVRAPMLALYRVRHPGAAGYPYGEYHSSLDTAARVPDGVLEASRDVVLHLLRALDANVTPRPRHPGEPFCSRYGVHVDWVREPARHQALFELLFQLDGTRTVADLAAACGVPFSMARELVDMLVAHDVVDV